MPHDFVSYFVRSRNLLFGVFLPSKTITVLRKIAITFRQVPLKDALLSAHFFYRRTSKILMRLDVLIF